MRPRPSSPIRTIRFAAALALVIGAAAGCNSEASTRAAAAADGPTTTAAQVTAPATIPPGTTLRLGDQVDYLKNILDRGGQGANLPYTVEWSNFVGGPPMLQAFKGGAIDAGFVASTPLLFADAQGQSIVAVAGWAPEHGQAGLLVNDPAAIRSWADLKGKRVAYQHGTSLEAGVLVALDKAGLSPTDVTTVDVPYPQLGATLGSGGADAAISAEPLISAYVKDHPNAKVAAPADELTDKASFLIASGDALKDAARTAALADLTTRLVRALKVINADPNLRAGIYQSQYGLTPERAREIAQASGPTRFLALPADIVPGQQKLSKLFHQAGQIPREVDVTHEFDGRFTELITKEQGQ